MAGIPHLEIPAVGIWVPATLAAAAAAGQAVAGPAAMAHPAEAEMVAGDTKGELVLLVQTAALICTNSVLKPAVRTICHPARWRWLLLHQREGVVTVLPWVPYLCWVMVLISRLYVCQVAVLFILIAEAALKREARRLIRAAADSKTHLRCPHMRGIYIKWLLRVRRRRRLWKQWFWFW